MWPKNKLERHWSNFTHPHSYLRHSLALQIQYAQGNRVLSPQTKKGHPLSERCVNLLFFLSRPFFFGLGLRFGSLLTI